MDEPEYGKWNPRNDTGNQFMQLICDFASLIELYNTVITTLQLH